MTSNVMNIFNLFNELCSYDVYYIKYQIIKLELFIEHYNRPKTHILHTMYTIL